MSDFNEKQTEYLRQYGLTEDDIISGTADVGHRLEVANRASPVTSAPAEEPTADDSTASAEPAPTPAQVEYLNAVGKPLAELSPAQKDDYEFWSRRGPIIARDELAEIDAKPLEDDAPVIVGAQSVLCPELIKDLSPVRKAGLADALETVKRGSRIGDSLSQQTSLAQAKFHLAPYIKRKG
ncbi:hypothetical protein [Mesorhizobium sp. M1272]|uniref:hypothetical protein n=1 Tax=Mesorhizobium sp. M1272 TaxID=2957074 RepID=UPI00333ADCF0